MDTDAVSAAADRAEQGATGGSSRQETVTNALRALDEPTEDDIVGYAEERGVPASYTRKALKKLVRTVEARRFEGTTGCYTAPGFRARTGRSRDARRLRTLFLLTPVVEPVAVGSLRVSTVALSAVVLTLGFALGTVVFARRGRRLFAVAHGASPSRGRCSVGPLRGQEALLLAGVVVLVAGAGFR